MTNEILGTFGVYDIVGTFGMWDHDVGSCSGPCSV